MHHADIHDIHDGHNVEALDYRHHTGEPTAVEAHGGNLHDYYEEPWHAMWDMEHGLGSHYEEE